MICLQLSWQFAHDTLSVSVGSNKIQIHDSLLLTILYEILRHNLRDTDNFSTTDNRPVPTVPVVWRFNCIHI